MLVWSYWNPQFFYQRKLFINIVISLQLLSAPLAPITCSSLRLPSILYPNDHGSAPAAPLYFMVMRQDRKVFESRKERARMVLHAGSYGTELMKYLDGAYLTEATT